MLEQLVQRSKSKQRLKIKPTTKQLQELPTLQAYKDAFLSICRSYEESKGSLGNLTISEQAKVIGQSFKLYNDLFFHAEMLQKELENQRESN